MKKLIISLLALLVVFGLNAQKNSLTVKHKRYETTFDTVLKYPVLVSWKLKKEMLSCSTRYSRPSRYYPDPLLKKYTNLNSSYTYSGFDRGHNYNAYDASCDSIALYESFYYSNMSPQHPSINRGDWKELEDFTRSLAIKYDSVKVWCGSWGNQKIIGTVAVPTDCWKVIYIYKTNEWFAFHFYNVPSANLGVMARRVSLSFIKKQTKVTFYK